MSDRRPTVDDAIAALAQRFGWPERRAGDLLVGRGDDPVDRVVLCVNGAEVERVTDEHALILAATPLAVTVRGRAYSSIVAGESVSHILLQAAERHQALLAAPDMLGGGRDGFDGHLAARLGLADTRVAAPRRQQLWKLTAFVPASDADAVRSAIFATGAGRIGDYDSCSFSTPGRGSFRGNDLSNPTIGKQGELEHVDELRLEVVCHSREEVDLAVHAMVRAHSYEEPAYDVYPVETPTARIGSGRTGHYDGTLDDLVRDITELTRSVPEVLAAGLDAVAPVKGLSVVASCGDAADVTDAVLFAEDLREAVVLCGWAGPEARTALRAAGHSVIISPAEGLLRALADDMDIEHATVDAAAERVTSAAREAAGVADQGALWQGASTSQPEGAEEADDVSAPDTLYFDGGSRGNPGPAAFGYALYSDDREVDADCEYIGDATNNVAEYTGLIEGVRRAIELGATSLTVFSDSELVVKQVHGEYKVKNAGIKPLHAEALEVLARLQSWNLSHVRRADNARADELVNRALDEQDVTA